MTGSAAGVADGVGEHPEPGVDGAGYLFPAAAVRFGYLLRPVVGGAFSLVGLGEVVVGFFHDLLDVPFVDRHGIRVNAGHTVAHIGGWR